MRHRITLGIALTFLAVGLAPAYDLSRHLWQHRLVFLVAPEQDDPDIIGQLQYLERRRDTVIDRDIRVFRLFADHGFVDERALSADSVARLRSELGVGLAGRLVILIGKDGGMKLRADLDTDLEEVFAQIDAMPMRRSEMRARRSRPTPRHERSGQALENDG